tara:strand:- start:183 stop:1757 length:1575 start_codon:yes stop_codon:yes gene_type:complete
MAFYTGAQNERLRINSAGVSTFYGDVTLEAAGANRISMRHTSGGNAVIKNPTAASLSFGTNNQDNELTIANGGKIGINISAPRSRLDVFETTTGNQTAIRIGNTNTPSSANDRRIEFVDGTGTTEGTNKFTYAYIQGYRAGGANSGDLILGTKPSNAAAPVERLRINDSGDILLGTDQATIGMNTADGSDNRSFSLCGGSDASQNRGALVGLFGNEHASFPGTLALRAGNVTGGHIEFSTGGTVRHHINKEGRIGLNMDPNTWHSNNQTIVQISGTNAGLNAFTRTNSGHITSNFYYKSDDAGVYQAASGHGLMQSFDCSGSQAGHRWFTTTAASSAAYSSASMVERQRIECDGDTYFYDHNGDSRMEIQKDGDFRVSNPGHGTNSSPSTNAFQGLSQLGHSHWGMRQYYSDQFNLTQNQSVDLFSNNTAHVDIIFWLNIRGYHSNRSFAAVHGTIGGYGITYHSQQGAAGGAFTLTGSTIATGRKSLRFTSTSGNGAQWWVWGWISGAAGTGTHTGRTAKQLN